MTFTEAEERASEPCPKCGNETTSFFPTYVEDSYKSSLLWKCCRCGFGYASETKSDQKDDEIVPHTNEELLAIARNTRKALGRKGAQ